VRDSGEGTEDTGADLAVLVRDILDDLRPRAERFTVRLEWTLGGTPPEGTTIAGAVAKTGVTLPKTVS
jgi:hypothetical protein